MSTMAVQGRINPITGPTFRGPGSVQPVASGMQPGGTASAGNTTPNSAPTSPGGSSQNPQIQQMIQQAMDSVLGAVPSNNVGMSASGFDAAVYNNLVQQGMNPQQAQAVSSYLSSNKYGGPSGYIGQGGGIGGNLPGFEQQVANQWAPGAAAAAAGVSTSANPYQANASPNAYQPSTVSSQFPGGIPQQTAPQIAGTSIQGTQMSPNQAVSAINNYLTPQFQQQDQALTAQLANAGIVGGTSAQAQQALGQGQQTQLQNDIQPFILSNQQLGENTQQFNAGQNQAAQEFNAGQLTGGQQYNINNQLNTANLNSNAYNQMLQYIMGLQNQDYLGQMGAASGLASGVMGTQSNAFTPTFQNPAQVNLGNLAGAFNTTTPSTPNSTSGPLPVEWGAGTGINLPQATPVDFNG